MLLHTLVRLLPGKSRAAELDQRALRPLPNTTPPSRLRSIGEYAQWIVNDIRAVRERDPAAQTYAEVVLAYPGLHAVWAHRPIHQLWRAGFTVLPRVLSNWNRFMTGVEIHPGAVLGSGVFIDHGMGVVIGETAVVGDDCLVYQGALLGGTSLDRKVRHPRLGQKVVVGANASVLGAISVGDRARVGSNSVVIAEVPSGATVVGVPGQVKKSNKPATEKLLDHANLPDPVTELIRNLSRELEDLTKRVQQIEGKRPALRAK